MSTTTQRPTAVVTGASSGIGAVYADRLAARGYDLILTARRVARLKTLAGEISEAHSVQVSILEADLTTEAGLTAVEALFATRGDIALLVNNAGSGKLAATAATSTADAEAVIALNITALTRLTQAALAQFLSRDSGAIINIASVMALHSLPITSIYSGTKGYVLNFTRGIQQEVKGTGVRVQVVLPAGIATEFYDHSGIPLSAFDPGVVMAAEALVDAALAGFDRGEAITLPSVHDLALWDTYEAARGTLFAATQTGKPAPRYLPGGA